MKVLVRIFVFASLFFVFPAFAQDNRREAKIRFDRAVQLADAGDLDRALAEFQKAYELVPNANVLSNIAEVQAALGRPADATASIDKLLASPGNLDAGAITAARTLREREDAKVGTLSVDANVQGARIEIDNVTAGTTPLAAPLRVGSGSHVVGVIASGHAPQRKSVSLAGRESKSVSFELVPLEARLAHLDVKCPLPGVQVLVDGQEVAKTPVPATLTFAPGKYRVEGRRDGYRTTTADITLGEGATGSITIDPQQDDTPPKSTLVVVPTETDAALIVDGRQAGTVTEKRLPSGPHVVRVEKAGFIGFEQNVTLKEGLRSEVKALLVPTPETRDAYVSHARTVKTVGWTLVISGAVLTVGGGVATALFTGDRSDKQKAFDDQVTKSQANGPGTCNDVCLAEFDQSKSNLDAAKTRQTLGIITTSVGVVAAGTGLVMLLLGNDEHKYDRIEPVLSLGYVGALGRF